MDARLDVGLQVIAARKVGIGPLNRLDEGRSIGFTEMKRTSRFALASIASPLVDVDVDEPPPETGLGRPLVVNVYSYIFFIYISICFY